MCKKSGVGDGKAAAQMILLTQLSKSELLPLLLPTLLLLKPLLPLLLLTSQMATLGLTQRLLHLNAKISEPDFLASGPTFSKNVGDDV